MFDNARALGALFGQGIGDALGIRYEFQAKRGIKDTKEQALSYQAAGRSLSFHVALWQPGEWSDDTEMAMCLLDAYIEDKGKLNPRTIAKHFQAWYHRDGRGCGTLTGQVLTDGMYALESLTVAQAAWEAGGSTNAPNGAVMRVSPIGVLKADLDWTERMAALQARTTHADPRCVASAVAVAVAVNHMVQGSDIETALADAAARAAGYHPEAPVWMLKSLDELELDGKGIGYTYKCLGAGFWALREYHRQGPLAPGELMATRFGNILAQVLLEGGDADTNGAVAGALLGAAIGISNMPSTLVHNLVGKDRLLRAYRQIRDLQ